LESPKTVIDSGLGGESSWLYTTIGAMIYVDSRTKVNPYARFEAAAIA